MPTIESVRPLYTDQDPAHGFGHILRVVRLAEQLATAEGADLEVVRAAALLHDIGGASTDDTRQGHQHTSARRAGEILREEGWPEEKIRAVQHCIRAHRFRDPSEQPQSLEARVLFDADKLDAIGAVGVVRAIAYAVQAQQQIFTEPSSLFLQTGVKEPGEDHTPYHEYLFKLRKLKDRLYTPSGKAIAAGRHRFMEQFFTQLRSELSGQETRRSRSE